MAEIDKPTEDKKESSIEKKTSKPSPIRKWLEKINWFPILLLGSGVILRILLAVSMDEGGIQILKTWAASAYSSTAPGMGFSRLLLYYKINSCTPFYTYVSDWTFRLFRFFQVKFFIFKIPQEIWDRVFNVFLKLPIILAHLGIAILIYFFIKQKFGSVKKATIASAIFFWLPPVIYAFFRRPETISFSLFFILLAIFLYERKGHIFPVLTGVALAIALLTDLNPFLALSVIAWILIKGIAEKQYFKGAIALLVLILAFFFISAPFHNFTFAPPTPPGEESRMSLTEIRQMDVNAPFQFDVKDIMYWDTFLESLKNHSSPLTNRIWEFLSQETKDKINTWQEGQPPDLATRIAVTNGLNEVLKRKDFYAPELFPESRMEKEINDLIAIGINNLTERETRRLNRLLIEAIYPLIIVKSPQPFPESDLKFYPFVLIYRNIHRFSSFTSNSAFNPWALNGLSRPDGWNLPGFGFTPRLVGIISTVIVLCFLFVFLYINKKRGVEASALYFALVYFTLFMLPTRGYDYLMMGVIPFLALLFFFDYRARLLLYGVTITFWTNLYLYEHFDLSPEAFTTVPALSRLMILLNVLLFLGGLAYYLKFAGEDDPTKEGEKLKQKLLEIFPTLNKCQEWLAIPSNQQLVALLFISFILRIWRLGVPESISFDEKYYTPMARDYFYGIKDPVEGASHPPLATYFIGIGIGLLGDNVYGWRIVSLFFSLMMLIVVYYFGKALFKNHIPALIATFLLSFDFMQFVHSRLGMLDMYSSFFNLCSYYLMYLYIEKGKKSYLWGLGATLALGAACKWTTIFTILGIGFIFVFGKIGGWVFKDRFEFGQNLRKANILQLVAILIIIPVLVQILVYLPLLGSVKAVGEKVQSLTKYHENLLGEDEISSPWWSWLFIINPITYTRVTVGPPVHKKIGDFDYILLKEQEASEKAAVTGMGNPLVWWFSIPAFIACMIIAYRSRSLGGIYSCMPFIFQFLPWAFVKRITYIFYMLDIVPYICLILAFCLFAIYNRGKSGRVIVYSYLSIVVASFIFFYPMLTALSVSPAMYEFYKIFRFWKF